MLTVFGWYTLIIIVIGALNNLLDQTQDVGVRLVILFFQFPILYYIITTLFK